MVVIKKRYFLVHIKELDTEGSVNPGFKKMNYCLVCLTCFSYLRL